MLTQKQTAGFHERKCRNTHHIVLEIYTLVYCVQLTMNTSKMLSLSQFSTDTIIKSLQKVTSHNTAPHILTLITQTRHKASNKRKYTCEILIFCHFMVCHISCTYRTDWHEVLVHTCRRTKRYIIILQF